MTRGTCTTPTPSQRGNEPLKGGTLRVPHSPQAATLPGTARTTTQIRFPVTADRTGTRKPACDYRQWPQGQSQRRESDSFPSERGWRSSPSGGRSRPPRAIYNPQRDWKAMPRCNARTRSGRQCQINASEGKHWCHTHDPDGLYRTQHPGLSDPVRMLPASLIGYSDWQLA
jgi:hypothetical protein